MGELYTPEFVDVPTKCAFSFDGIRPLGILIRVDGSEYSACDEASHNWFASGKKGKYGPGLLNTCKDDPRKCERVGLLGEMGVGKVFHKPVDLRYRKGGDDCDFLIKGQKIDVKTNHKLKELNPSTEIIVYENEHDLRYDINCKYRPMDVYLISYLREENRQEKWADIVLVGYHLGVNVKKNFKSLIRKTRIPSKDHYNIELLYRNAMSIFDFYNWVFSTPMMKTA